MNRLNPSGSDITACGILNTVKEETVEAQAGTASDRGRQQAIGNREAQEVRHL
jgi:hypothetical protein